MKSAVPKAGLHGNPLTAAGPLSHIPLPRRKTSCKSDKGVDADDTDSELGSVASRSQAKMSLLSSTSFCCASGQKEDYIPDARIVPASRPPKKRPPNICAKKDLGSDPSTPKSPLLSVGKGLLTRNKKGKICPDSQEEIQVHMSENGVGKPIQEDIKSRTGNQCLDNRLRSIDDRRKITPPSPQRRIPKESAISRKDQLDVRKYSDDMRKLRKDCSVPILPIESSYENSKKCKHTSSTAHSSSSNQKPLDSRTDQNNSRSVPFSNISLPGNYVMCDAVSSDVGACARDADIMEGCHDVLKKSHESDDFDCPCCDRTSVMMDEAGLSDIEVKMFTSCDVIAPMECAPPECKQSAAAACDKTERALEKEVKDMKENLQLERKKLQNQQDRIHQLEDEVLVMQQLRQELDKEKELRKIAEDKLLELLDYEKRMEVLKRENAKTMESKSTQMEVSHDALATDNSSPLLLGNEGRLRKYQNYIAKLENDNRMLVNELKKFKDLSPRSQEEQAKVLVEKLGQMERSSHKQQMQYESCLDEVANKLVQTLLAQKRLEEECKILHLRVEQLEQENGTLMELIDDDKDTDVEKTEDIKSPNSESSTSNLQNRKPSHHPLTLSSKKRSSNFKKSSISSEERKKDSPKSTNANLVKNSGSELKSPVTSPTSPGLKPPHASKIPSFNTSKPLLVRKKSDMDMKLTTTRNDVPAREASSSELVPNSKQSSTPSSSKIKSPSSLKGTKGTCSKRKRLSRNGSPADKGPKDSKQRMKSNHIRWEQRRMSPEDVTPLCKSIDRLSEISPIKAFPQSQQVWSFNCEVTTQVPVLESEKKVADSIEAFRDKLCVDTSVEHSEDFGNKQNSSTSESSTTIEGVNRTRDEGYSTMSSDLQPDSTADTTISEPEHSATFVITEKDLNCGSDDSVTECLDGSMCSSSDSGFGPLHQVATSVFPSELPEEERPTRTVNELPKLDVLSRKHGTVKCKEQIASVKPTVRTTTATSEQAQNVEPNSICDNFLSDSLKFQSSSDVHVTLSSKSTEISQEFETLSPSKFQKEKKCPNIDQSTMIDCWNFPKEILNLTNYRKTWHLGPTKSIYDDKIVFCTRHSYIDDNLFDEKIETAEKATLTEPEEELWREKALAPFIDESIWSLYSSEGDIQVKHFPLEPLLSEPSLDKLISNCNPCIVVTENIEPNPRAEVFDTFNAPIMKSSNNSSATDLNNLSGQTPEKFRTGLERVASDTVLYLKDAFHELENSMRRGLKSSKNIPALHQNSGSESETSPTSSLGLKPELLRTLEATMSGQNQLAWPSPTRSSSMSSLQSSTSCHVVSDDTEDVEMIRTSRKGSQDPDLSSASDAEYENLEHKDFVERWLQKEIVSNNLPKMTVTTLEPVEEMTEFSSPSVRRKTSLPSTGTKPRTPILTRKRFMSYPTDPSAPNPSLRTSSPTDGTAYLLQELNDNHLLSSANNITIEDTYKIDCTEDGELVCLDPEAKEFNGDFYTLCSIGSLKSLDHCSPAKSLEAKPKQVSEPLLHSIASRSTNLSSKTSPSKSEKLKPTGLVKPTRPVTLAVAPVPKVPKHAAQNNSPSVPSTSNFSKSSADPTMGSKVQRSTESIKSAKTNVCSKVPPNNFFSVFPSVISKSPASETSPSIKAPSIGLPKCSTPRGNERGPLDKSKSPTKIIIKSSSPSKQDELSKRHQWKRDRLVARQSRLKEGCGTAWIHLQANPELSDPTLRINLLDSIKAPTSSSGSSSTEEDDNEVLIVQTNSHLHRICKERRHKAKASANNPLYDLRKRTSIMGRRELFYRFGDKEREAIACFDFLEEIPSQETQGITLPDVPTSPPSSLGLMSRKASCGKERFSFLSPATGGAAKGSATTSKMALARSPFSNYSARKLRLPNLWNQPLSHNMSSSSLNSQDCELLDHISLSDSCAESYSSTPESYDDAS